MAQSTQKGNFLMKGEQYHITIPGQEIISDGKDSMDVYEGRQ